jgi:hypothetical protein
MQYDSLSVGHQSRCDETALQEENCNMTYFLLLVIRWQDHDTLRMPFNKKACNVTHFLLLITFSETAFQVNLESHLLSGFSTSWGEIAIKLGNVAHILLVIGQM